MAYQQENGRILIIFITFGQYISFILRCKKCQTVFFFSKIISDEILYFNIFAPEFERTCGNRIIQE